MHETKMSNMNFLCELRIEIPRLDCLFSTAKAVSSTVELVNSVTSDCINLFNFAMRAFACQGFSIQLVRYSDG